MKSSQSFLYLTSRKKAIKVLATRPGVQLIPRLNRCRELLMKHLTSLKYKRRDETFIFVSPFVLLCSARKNIKRFFQTRIFLKKKLAISSIVFRNLPNISKRGSLTRSLKYLCVMTPCFTTCCVALCYVTVVVLRSAHLHCVILF